MEVHDRQRRPAPSGYASRFKHPRDAGVHFVLLYEFAARVMRKPVL